jgi:hypothetical protein
MACAIAVARRGQQRSLARIFQPEGGSRAFADGARMRAWSRLTAFCL